MTLQQIQTHDLQRPQTNTARLIFPLGRDWAGVIYMYVMRVENEH